MINFLDLAGTFVFAVSGTHTAMQKRFDLFGALFIGFVTAVGGGTLRDLLIGSTPVSWMKDINYSYIIVAAVVFTILFRNFVQKLRTTLFLFDTIGIGVFTVIGLEKALQIGIPIPMAIMMGVASAVAGGILRDVFSNEIPLIFHKEIYATACFAGGVIFVILYKFTPLSETFIVLSTISAIITIRLLSVRLNWSLPRLPKHHENHGN
jgi:uncharacterized membrane protein YeiH